MSDYLFYLLGYGQATFPLTSTDKGHAPERDVSQSLTCSRGFENWPYSRDREQERELYVILCMSNGYNLPS